MSWGQKSFIASKQTLPPLTLIIEYKMLMGNTYKNFTEIPFR